MVYVEFQDENGDELTHVNGISVPSFEEGQSLESEFFDGYWIIEKVHHVINDGVWGILVECRRADDEVKNWSAAE